MVKWTERGKKRRFVKAVAQITQPDSCNECVGARKSQTPNHKRQNPNAKKNLEVKILKFWRDLQRRGGSFVVILHQVTDGTAACGYLGFLGALGFDVCDFQPRSLAVLKRIVAAQEDFARSLPSSVLSSSRPSIRSSQSARA
jgi:hypothetical protein